MTQPDKLEGEIDVLLGHLSHKIRNPIHAMTINLQVLEKLTQQWSGTSGKKARAHLAYVSEDLQLLSRSLTEFTELIAPLDEKRVLVPFAQLTHGSLQRLAKQPHPGVEVVSGSSDLQIRVNRAQIELALSELIKNAIEASTGRGAVVLSCSRNKSEYLVQVKDRGPGVPRGEQGKIFQAFYTTKKGRVGLGLTRALRFVATNRGRLTVSRVAGETVFTMRFEAED